LRGPTPPDIGGDRGAAVVEMAMVLPVLMMLLLGMISGAGAWNQNQALGQGGRVAARYASTMPLPADDADMDDWLDGVVDRAVAASEGKMLAGVDGRAVCVAYVDPAGAAADQTASRTLDSAGTRTSGTDPCFADGQGDDERRVQVVLERHGVLNVGFHQQTLELRRRVVYRYEADGGL
jgi:hypothetical protein